MSFLLDTCAISEYSQKRPDPAVIQFIDDLPEESLFLSAITIGELHKGIAKLKDAARLSRVQNFIDQGVTERFAGRIIPVDVEIARAWGDLIGRKSQVGRPPPTIDALIAATAIVHRLRVITRNVTDFHLLGVEVVDPWQH